MKYLKNRSMGDHTAMFESKYARLAAMQTSLEDSTKVDVLMNILQRITKYEPFTMLISVTGEKHTAWSQVSSPFVKGAKHLNRNTEQISLIKRMKLDDWLKIHTALTGTKVKKRKPVLRQMTSYYCKKWAHGKIVIHISAIKTEILPCKKWHCGQHIETVQREGLFNGIQHNKRKHYTRYSYRQRSHWTRHEWSIIPQGHTTNSPDTSWIFEPNKHYSHFKK